MDATGRRHRGALTTIGTLAALALTPALAHAAPSFAVTTTDDAPGAGQCASGGACSLRQALAAAAPGGGTIALPAGDYRLTQGALRAASFAEALTLTGAGAGATSIVQTSAGERVLEVLGSVEIRGVTITGGDLRGAPGSAGTPSVYLPGPPMPPARPAGPGGPGEAAFGGGVRNFGTLVLTDVVVTGNRAEGGAGGTGGPDTGSPPMGMGGSGGPGGQARGGGIANAGVLRLVRTVVSGNTALAGRGGRGGFGMSDGTSGAGGDAFGGGIDNAGQMTLADTSVRANSAVGGGPGSAFFANSPAGAGVGGGVASNGSSMTVERSTLSGNAAVGGANETIPQARGGDGLGGGLFASTEFVVRSSTVAANAARAGASGADVAVPPVAAGGGIWAAGAGALEQVTVAGNAADASAGGGTPTGTGGNLQLVTDGAVKARGVLIAGGAGATASANCDGPLDALGGNVEGGSAGQCGAEQTVPDAKLAGLADNGGPVATVALLPDSPARDAGSCTDLADATVASDQRGWPRPSGGCDAGAYELVPPAVAVSVASDVGSAAATLNGTVGWARPGTTYRFSYGVADAGEQALPERTAPPARPAAAVSEPLTGLRPGTTYRFRLVVTGPDGSVTAAGSFATTTAATVDPPPRREEPRGGEPPRGQEPPAPPALTRVSIAPGAFVVATARGRGRGRRVRGGARVRFTLDRAASVRARVTQMLPGRRAGGRCVAPGHRAAAKGKRCTRAVSRGTLALGTRGAGVTTFALTGRVGPRALAPGRYRLTLTATADGRASRPATVTFTVRRR